MSFRQSPLDNQEFLDVGHQVVELIARYFDSVKTAHVFPDVTPKALTDLLTEPLPASPSSPENVLLEVQQKILPYCTNVSHPGYMGLITPSPNPMGIIADFICSAINQNLATYSIGPSATALERQVVRWLSDLCGYGNDAGGNLTSGGMMANFIGMKLARDAISQDLAQRQGISNRWAVYASEERHVSIDKAVDCVGLGREALRVLPTSANFELRLDALEEAIAADKRNNIRPLCLVGIFGTTNTGAVDNIRELRYIADREQMWLHVDAAYGGGMLLSREWPMRDQGLQLADSITIDPHKWFYAPLDVGALLVKDHRRLTASFGIRPPYLTDEFDPTGDRYQYYVHGFEQSRRFRGLKVWMSLKRYGTREIGNWIDSDVCHAKYLYSLAAEDPEFEAASSPRMSAVCFRFCPKELSRVAAKRLHVEVARRIERGGQFWISTTELKEKTWFRVNPVNFNTRLEHMGELFNLVRSHCRELLQDQAANTVEASAE